MYGYEARDAGKLRTALQRRPRFGTQMTRSNRSFERIDRKGTAAPAAQITGPHHEFDKYDEPTGATYYRCERCGAESIRRGRLAENCYCDDGERL